MRDFHSRSHWRRFALLTLILLCAATGAWAQGSAVSGLVTDQSGAVVPSATVTLTNELTGTVQTSASNGSGIYSLPFVTPGRYTLAVEAPGFKRNEQKGIAVETGQALAIGVRLEVGEQTETVTVDGSGIRLNTTDASVSTFVDRQFVENMPMNGRSFQSLMTLVPGVALVPSSGVNQSGDLSVNGQRTESNYFTVDGVSVNTGAGKGTASYGAGYSGSTPGYTILGTTQSLVSIDALEEFRAITSTYSAEYGRAPGGQFAFTTRSGTNKWHGSLYDYLRNNALDANNWFNNALASPKLPQRQNDFGGTFGGTAILPGIYDGRNKTFFFVSYEGMRITSAPPATVRQVPSLELRENAPPALQPFLNAFPLPDESSSIATQNGMSPSTIGFSVPSSLNSTSVRVDHNFTDRVRVFGRYNLAPSDQTTRHGQNIALIRSNKGDVETLTLGGTFTPSPYVSNDTRFNTTTNNYTAAFEMDDFGGAAPLGEDFFFSLPGVDSSSWLQLYLGGPAIVMLPTTAEQGQINITNSTSVQLASHNLKFGLDYRRIANSQDLPSTFQYGGFYDEESILTNSASFYSAWRYRVAMEPLFRNFSLFVQDEWRVTPRLSLSLGTRWEVNPPPSDANGNLPYTITSTDLLTLTVAPKGTPQWKTTYDNFAPRLGAAYQLHDKSGAETVLRAGLGLFYDSGNTHAAGGVYGGLGYSSYLSFSGSAFPLTAAQVESFPEPVVELPYGGVGGYDPNLELPRTWEWNVALQQNLGRSQSLTVSYVAAAGRKLLKNCTYNVNALGNTNFVSGNNVSITTNGSRSDYHSLQGQFQRRLSKGIQALASYTWSHAIDDISTNDSAYTQKRASSDLDVRHNFQAAISMEGPTSFREPVMKAIFGNWALDTRIMARSALPVEIKGNYALDPSTGAFSHFRPNLNTNVPLYLDDPTAPGGRVINCLAFVADCSNPNPSLPQYEGNAGRNIARGFGAYQTNVALRRRFPFTERVGLQLRLEAFNLFNQPNFGSIYNRVVNAPSRTDGTTLFGQANNTLNNQLGSLNPVHQMGGPRSLQIALKLQF